MKKVIVTGGLGFIGSNLIELLLKKKYKVINVDKNTYSSNFYNIREFKKKGIIFCPYIDNPINYYTQTHILVHPTKYAEGLSMVILESAYLGLRIITTRNRGTEEILLPSYKYFLDQNTPYSIAKSIANVSRDKSYFESIKMDQTKRVSKYFNKDCVFFKTLSFLKRVKRNSGTTSLLKIILMSEAYLTFTSLLIIKAVITLVS